MAYAIYSEHPESHDRKAADFTKWSLWAAENAPWTGVSIPDMASLLQGVCNRPEPQAPVACEVLDQGGMLQPAEVAFVLRTTEKRMSEKIFKVFQHAAKNSYPVRVVFSKGFGAISASAYLAKDSSA